MRAVIDPNIATYLLERFPGVRRAGLPTMWMCACAWVEEQVKPQYLTGNIPVVFESAALLRVQAVCNPQSRQALLFAAAELLQPYARQP